ncbi:MAG: hypothetical protein GX620_12745 [Chloroflexi bacterium]|nr:hypothetical protein [Chloroflexota bacterium]
MDTEEQSLNALVLFNSASPTCREDGERVRMYIEHFGLPADPLDLLHEPLPTSLSRYPIVILAHPRLDPTGRRLGGIGLSTLQDALRAGTGMLSFDPDLSYALLGQPVGELHRFSEVEISSTGHTVTARHAPGQSFSLAQDVLAPSAPGEPLLVAGGYAFLSAARENEGRLVTWASPAWADTRVLGPMSGLDDLLWRGLVWAARKPFCLRGLPPLVTMRVDDVVGSGTLWDESPLYWVEESARLGWKPWLGLFIYNNSPETVHQLQSFTARGQATIFPHAFGRPNRGAEDSFFYYEDALPLRADEYDEFIFFDHQHGVPWSDHEAMRGLHAVDRWFAAHAPLPMSSVVLPHWYEMGSNTALHVFEKWNCDIVASMNDVDMPLAPDVQWLPLGPFRRIDPPGECFPFTPGQRAGRPIYYADFVNLGGCRFFNSLTEIRRDHPFGFEWEPNNDVAGTTARAVAHIRRALDSMAMATLFTHETDYLCKISPENWRIIMEAVTRELAPYNPRMVTLDEGACIQRATRTARLTHVSRARSGEFTARFSTPAECPTTMYCFDTDSLDGHLIDVPAFSEEVRFTL